jgi:hypothetical protein
MMNCRTDAEGNRENLLRMVALKERLPELIIVPAHDMRAFAKMPTLSDTKWSLKTTAAPQTEEH